MGEHTTDNVRIGEAGDNQTIAERIFWNHETSEHQVLRIYMPVKIEKDELSVSGELLSVSFDALETFEFHGVDSLQALQNFLIGVRRFFLGNDLPVSWEIESERGNYGLYPIFGSYYGMNFEKYLDTKVEEIYASWRPGNDEGNAKGTTKGSRNDEGGERRI